MRFYWPIAKVDAEQRMVWGYASTAAMDDQGETVTRDALSEALDDYMRFANIREMHQPSAVGIAREASVDDKGLYLGAKIVDGDAWEKVVEGVYKGFSIGGRVTSRDPADRSVITGLRLTEISVVDRPANPEAVFDCWKFSSAGAPAPVQVWDCGSAGHRHVTKAEAALCLAAPASISKAGAAADPPPAAELEPSKIDYADPGYQPDGHKRYPLDSEAHIRAAWAFIHMPANVRRYTPDQFDRVKERIAAAWRAAIDPAGPPETTRKNVADPDRLAVVIADLDALCDSLPADAGEALQQIIEELCDALDIQVEPGIAAFARAATLRKSHSRGGVNSDIAKLAGEIMPRLDALQKRVDEIARTPLPPQTIARGAALSKRDDADPLAPPFVGASGEIVAALARMTDEERTLTLIKAAHATPLRPVIR